jgi:hypothetical protein
MFLAVSDDVSGGKPGSISERNARDNLLAEIFVGNADDGTLPHV